MADSSKYHVPGRSRNRRVKLFVLTVFLGIIVILLPLSQTGPYRGSVSGGQSTIGPQSAGGPGSGAYFDHVVVIMMENEGISNICGGNPPPCNGSNTPYLSSLANSYGIGQQYLSLITTSWPDYYGILGATLPANCSKTNTAACYPPVGSQTNLNLVDRFEAAGVSWKGYMENQPLAAGCALSSSEPYVTEHNGFIAFQDIVNSSARCNQIVLANPSTCGTVVDCALLNDLNGASVPAPNFMWVTPSDCNDMRSWTGCSNGCTSGGSTTCVKDGDNYLKSLVPSILNSYTFTNTRAALFVTFDEGMGYCPLNSSSEDCLYAVWAGPVAKTSFYSGSLYNHYSLTKTIEVNWNLATLTSNDANANPMTEFFTTVGPSFSISASPSSVTFPQGGGSSSTITLTSLNGFTGTVSLSANSSPSGLSLSLSPQSVTLSSGGTGSSTLSISSSTTGSYTVTITGTSGSQSRSTTVNVNVPDFSISSSPASITVSPGSSGTSSISLTSIGGFTGTVTLSSTVSPAGPTASLSPTSVTLSSGGTATSILTVSAQSSTPIGNYTVTVTGSSGSLSHSTTVLVAVRVAPDFSVSDNPTSLTLSRSATASSTITVTSLNGFSGTVTLSVSGAGSGLRTSLSSSSLTLTSGGSATSTLNIKTLKHAQLGTYTLTITVTSGGLSHSTTLTVTVTA